MTGAEVSVTVTDKDISPGDLATAFYASNPHGAVTTFAGFVRDFNAQGDVETPHLSAMWNSRTGVKRSRRRGKTAF